MSTSESWERFEFLEPEKFLELSEDARLAYMERVHAILGDVLADTGDAGLRLDFTSRYTDFLEAVLKPKDFEELIRRPIWERIWEDAEHLVDSTEPLVESPELSEAERASATDVVEKFRAVAEHKRALSELDESPPPPDKP
jgi:hypothetical protein